MMLEDILREMKRQADLADMALSDLAHSFYRRLDDLDEQATVTFCQVLTQITRAGSEAATVAAEHLGYLTGKLTHVHQVCPACQTNHDDALRCGQSPEAGT